MKLINTTGIALDPSIVSEAERLYLTSSRKKRPSKGVSAVSACTECDLFTILAFIAPTPAGDKVLVVNGNPFRIVSASGNTVHWSGGTPPFTVSVQQGDLPGTLINVDESVYTQTERQFTVITYHEKMLIDDDQDWLAYDNTPVSGDASQASVGVVIQDSATPPREIFAPFTPTVTYEADGMTKSGLSAAYDHFGPGTWCAPIIVWPDATIAYGSAIPAAHVPKPGVVAADPYPDLPGTLTYDPPLGTILSAGVHTVSVSFAADDALHYHDATKTMALTVAKLSQTISGFTISGDMNIGSVNTLAATASSGLPVAFSCPDANAVIDFTVTPNTITFNAPGEYTVYADQVGNVNYNAASELSMTRTVADRLPTPNFTVTRDNNTVGTVVTCTDTSTTDPDGDAVTISWELTLKPVGSSCYPTTTSGVAGSSTTFTPDVPGTYTITLTVTDSWGQSATASNTSTAASAMTYQRYAALPRFIQIFGGIPPYSFVILGTYNNLSLGNYNGDNAFVTVYKNTAPACGTGSVHVYDTAGNSVDIPLELFNISSCSAPSFGYSISGNTLTVVGGSPPYVFSYSLTNNLELHENSDGASAYVFAPSGSQFCGTGTIYVKDNALRTFSVSAADLGVPATCTNPFVVTIQQQGVLYASGGVPPYSGAITPAGSTGGMSVWIYNTNYIDFTVSGSCYCPGSGITVRDSAGSTVFVPFGGSAGPSTVCTSGCPADDGGTTWDLWDEYIPPSGCAQSPPPAGYPEHEVISNDGNWKILFQETFSADPSGACYGLGGGLWLEPTGSMSAWPSGSSSTSYTDGSGYTRGVTTLKLYKKAG